MADLPVKFKRDELNWLEHNETFVAKKVTYADSANLDAFGRLRVSEITSLLEVKQIVDNLPLFIDRISNGTATQTYNTNESSTTLATVADGDYAIAQTFQRTNYASGKSHLIFITVYDFDAETNITKRLGYFNSSTVAPYTANLDGLFFESSSGTVSLNVYRNGTQIESTAQANWNIDPLDGTGPSKMTVDWSKDNIFVIDFQWLGVGRIRWGLEIDGIFIPVHQTLNANNIQKVYMSSPNQPLRWEIRQAGAGSGSFTQICSSVGSEGSLNQLGVLRHKDSGTVSSLSAGGKYAVLGIRLQSGKSNCIIDLQALSMICTQQNDLAHWELVLNPTVAGTFTYSNETNSCIQTAVGSVTNTITGGTEIDGGYFSTSLPITAAIPNALKLGKALDGTVDEIVLVVRPITNNISVEGSLTWREQ